MEKRYNVFNQIHKGLRNMLYDTAVCLQRADFSSAEAAEAVGQLELVLALFDEHAEHEDKYVLPHILAHDAKLKEEFEKDHVIDHKLAEDLNAHVAGWKAAETAEARTMAGNRIFYAFNEFIAFNLYHMNKEENELLYTLWKHFTDEEIIGMQMQIIQSIAPETLAIENEWMMRSINDAEIIAWLTAVKHTAPAEAFAGMMQLAQRELGSIRFEKISAAFATQAVTA